MARKRLGEILIEAGVLTEAKLRAALAEQRRWGGPLGRLLVEMKLITEDVMVKALSHQLNFPVVNIDGRQIDFNVLDIIPGELAEQHSAIPFNLDGKFLDVAMADPTNLGIIDEIRIRTRLNVRPYLAGPKMIERALARYYNRGMAAVTGFGVEHGLGGGVEGTWPTTGTGAEATDVPQGAGDIHIGGGVSAGVRRAQDIDALRAPQTPPSSPGAQSPEVASLQARVQKLEALVARDEDVLRKLLALLIDKGIATREEILERIK